jgi:hypothetical protein
MKCAGISPQEERRKMVAKVTAVEQELQKATGVKKKVAEKFQKYAARLIEAVQELKDPEWEDLSAEAQTWVNAGAKVVKAGKGDIEPFPDDAEEEEEEEKEDPEAEEENEEENEEDAEAEPATRTRGGGKTTNKSTARASTKSDGKVGDTEKAAKGSKKEGSTKVKAPKGEGKQVGAQTMIKQIMCDEPKISTDDLLAKLGKKGYTPTPLAVSSIRSGFRHSLKVLKEAGHLPKMEL